jgi:hypothetical protein
MREVVIDLPLHQRNLLRERRAELRIPGRGHALRFVRQHRQRRLQSMRKITG